MQPEDSILRRHWLTDQKNRVKPEASCNIFLWSIAIVVLLVLVL